MKTDETLWDDFQAGDESALAELMARYEGPFLEFIEQRGADPDVLQEAFIIFTGQPRNGGYFRPYLLTIVNKLILERRAADRREARRLASPEMEVLAEVYQR